MFNEKMQRAMDFIVEQQAQFAASIQRLDEERERDNTRLARVEDSFQLLVRLVQTAETRLDRLELFSNSHELAMTGLETKMTELAESQALTNEEFREFIRLMRERRNGTGNEN
jgi:hypothetical protein